MVGNRRLLLLLLFIILIVLLGLGGFYLYLSGGEQAGDPNETSAADVGLIHVRTLYTYGDEARPLAHPVGTAVDGEGNIYVTLRDVARVIKFNSDGDYISDFGEHGTAPGQLLSPLGIAADSLSNHVYVTDRARLRVVCYDLDGQFLWETPILSPLSPAVGPDGTVYVGTFGPIVEMTSQGEYVGEVGTRGLSEGQFDFPRALAVGDDDFLYVADTNNTRIQKIEMSGELTATVAWTIGEPPRYQDDPNVRFIAPTGIAVDAKGRIVTLDGFRHTIEVFDPETGESIWDFGENRGPGDGSFNLPTTLAHIDNDYFVVADTFNDRVQIIRLLTPEENNIVARNPWLWYLLPLLFLPFIPLFGRRRIFATTETLERAIEDGNARLILAVYSKVHVLKSAFERYKDVEEEGVVLGEYLVPLSPVSSSDDEEVEFADEKMLADVARPTGGKRILLARHRALCVDRSQCERVSDHGAKTVDYDDLIEEYSLKK